MLISEDLRVADGDCKSFVSHTSERILEVWILKELRGPSVGSAISKGVGAKSAQPRSENGFGNGRKNEGRREYADLPE